jgi:hypothetical protein
MGVKKVLVGWLAVFSLIVVAGCGSKDGFCEFGGVVTWNGEVVPGVSIDFTPVGKDMRGSIAITDEEGAFKALCTVTRSGAQYGENDVEFSFDGDEDIWYSGEYKGSPALAKEVANYSKEHGPIRIDIKNPTMEYRFELPVAE